MRWYVRKIYREDPQTHELVLDGMFLCDKHGNSKVKRSVNGLYYEIDTKTYTCVKNSLMVYAENNHREPITVTNIVDAIVLAKHYDIKYSNEAFKRFLYQIGRFK